MGQQVTTKQIADRIGVTQRTVARWVTAGLIPYVLVGKTYLLDWDDVQVFLEERKGGVTSVSETPATPPEP